ncbi:MAG: MarR family transcriptional regulator [Myxococcales bacterium]
MTKPGWYKRELEDWAELVSANRKPVPKRSAPEDGQKASWLAAMRWRRAVERVTRQADLTFTQWLVLDAIRELFEETGDASIQNEISVRAELDRATISVVMRNLERKGLVDRGIDMIGTAWRTFLTKRAVSVLDELRPKISAISTVSR